MKVKGLKSGTTLIEMLIVMVLAIVLVGGAVVGFGSVKGSKDAKGVAERLKAKLLEARSQAMTPKDDVQDVQKVKVEVDTVNNKLKTYYCTTPTTCEEELPFQVPKGITVAPATNHNMTPMTGADTGKFYFSYFANDAARLGQLTDITNINNPVRISVKNNSTNEEFTLEIGSITGMIEIL